MNKWTLLHGNGYPLQYSCLEESLDRGAWPAIYSPWGHKELDTTEWLTHTHKACQVLPANNRSFLVRKDSLLQISEGEGPVDTLISDFCPPELWEQTSVVLRYPVLGTFLGCSLENQYPPSFPINPIFPGPIYPGFKSTQKFHTYTTCVCVCVQACKTFFSFSIRLNAEESHLTLRSKGSHLTFRFKGSYTMFLLSGSYLPPKQKAPQWSLSTMYLTLAPLGCHPNWFFEYLLLPDVAHANSRKPGLYQNSALYWAKIHLSISSKSKVPVLCPWVTNNKHVFSCLVVHKSMWTHYHNPTAHILPK